MSLVELVAEVARLGVLLSATGETLHVDAPSGALTNALRVRLAAEKPTLLMLYSPITFVALRGGLTVPAAAIDLAVALEAAGFVLGTTADHAFALRPVAKLTEVQRAAIFRWRHHLAAIVEYRPPDE